MVWDEDMSEPGFTNRRRRADNLTFRWLAGILITLLLLVATAWAKDMQTRTTTSEAALSSTQIQQAAMNQQLIDIKEQLVEIKTILRTHR